MRWIVAASALMFVPLLAPGVAAADCPALTVWAQDDAKDVYGVPENLNGGMDILELRVGEGGTDCDHVVVGVTVSDPLLIDPALGSGEQDADHPFNAGSQRVIVDLDAPDGEPSVQLQFVWAFRTHTTETSHEGWWVELWVDGAKVSDTGDGDNSKLSDTDDGGYMDALVARSELNGVTAWTGATARTSEWGHDAYAENGGPGYEPDTLVAEDTYTFGYGIGVPPAQEVAPLDNETVNGTVGGNATGNGTGEETMPEGQGGAPTEAPAADCEDNTTCADGNETLDSTPDDQESPGPALPLLAMAIALVAVLRRRY